MRILPVVVAAALVATCAVAPVVEARPRAGTTLVELRPSARCTAATTVAHAGGTIVAPTLGLYLVPNSSAARLVRTLRARGALRFSAPNRPAGTLGVSDFGDPLVATEWWRTAVGADAATPPPPGRPVTIVDSGIDVTHPDFLGRPNTQTLNDQEPAGFGGEHGTAVGSLVGAPADGVGLVGIYPEAVLRSWDAAKGAGTELSTAEIVAGLLAATAGGPGVVNLSLGSAEKELAIEQAVYAAVRGGMLIVAAAGNDGDAGSPLGYPASLPHVLTAAATDRTNAVASFSSKSRFVDLAAPGVDVPIATARGKGWRGGDGTSFAAPLVSGASAWVWTVRPELDATQVFEVMRRSAVDIGAPGRDDAAGFGLLNVPAALAYPAPIRDPLEPNDDIEFVRPGGLYDTSIPSLTSPRRHAATVEARIDRVEDPRDVYRVWLPRDGHIAVTVTADANVDLGLWRKATTSVLERISGTDRLARGIAPGTTDRLAYANRGRGRFAYLAVYPPQGVHEARYALRVDAAA